MKKFVKIGPVLENSIKRLGLDKGIKKWKVLDVWESAVGKPIADVTRPGYMKGKTLFVFVTDSIWLQELKFLEERIIEKINHQIGDRVIDTIYFKMETERKIEE